MQIESPMRNAVSRWVFSTLRLSTRIDENGLLIITLWTFSLLPGCFKPGESRSFQGTACSLSQTEMWKLMILQQSSVVISFSIRKPVEVCFHLVIGNIVFILHNIWNKVATEVQFLFTV